MKHRILLVCLCQLVLAGTALAQSVNVTLLSPPVVPAEPTANLPVSASVRVLSCSDIPIAVERVGAVINLRYVNDNCPIIPIPEDKVIPLGTLPAGTYDLRVLEVGDPADPRLDDEAIFTVGPAPCSGLCLVGNRFTVTAEWSTETRSGSAQPVPMTDATGAFWFFDDDNVELVVKVLDACSYNSRFWFFAGGLTDVEVVLHVHDNLTGADRTYENPLGHPFRPITDTQAFGCP